MPIIVWWVLLQLFGLVGLPLTFRLFGNLPDRGYAFARPLGILVTGYVLWMGASLGFWRNNLGGIVISLLIVVAVGAWLYLKRIRTEGRTIINWFRSHFRYWLSVEVLFSVALVGWAIYKAHNPNLETAGGEKWMEIAFVNAVLGSENFPPQDPWLSGFGISYYYFGYVLMALITRLSGLQAAVAYNLFVPTLFALTLTGAFCIVYNLVVSRRGERSVTEFGEEENTRAKTRLDLTSIPGLAYGLLGAVFVGVLGNLEGLLEVFHSRGLLPVGFWRWLDIKDINLPPEPGGWIPSRFMWWWRASRVIHDCSFQGLLSGNCNPPGGDWEVIDEFPFFSFLLGDVHPHVLALPFVLLVLGLALNLIMEIRRSGVLTEVEESPREASFLPGLITDVRQVVNGRFGGWATFLLLALCLGSLGFLNTWDFPIYLFIVTAAFAVVQARCGSQRWLNEAIGVGIGLGLVGGLLYLPFYVSFKSQAGGLLPNIFNPTSLLQFLVFFGPFLLPLIVYLGVLSGYVCWDGWRRRLTNILVVVFGVPLLAIFVTVTLIFVSPSTRSWVESLLTNPDLAALLGGGGLNALAGLVIPIRLSNPWTFVFLSGLLAWVLLFWSAVFSPSVGKVNVGKNGRQRRVEVPDAFALILVGVGVVLPLAVEFIYLRDNFGIRMNTVFKFYFQAWILLGLAAAYGAFVVSQQAKGGLGLAWRLGLALLVAGGLVYPVLAIPEKTAYFTSSPTLDGMAWLEDAHPDDYQAIRWLQANAPAGSVILEAPGDHYAAYQYTGRVSALTGLPTLLGWGNHEHQWRGSYEEPARREPDIELLFNGLDKQTTRTLLDRYDVTYVYVGPLERERYNPNGLAKFKDLLDEVYNQGSVAIYQRLNNQQIP